MAVGKPEDLAAGWHVLEQDFIGAGHERLQAQQGEPGKHGRPPIGVEMGRDFIQEQNGFHARDGRRQIRMRQDQSDDGRQGLSFSNSNPGRERDGLNDP